NLASGDLEAQLAFGVGLPETFLTIGVEPFVVARTERAHDLASHEVGRGLPEHLLRAAVHVDDAAILVDGDDTAIESGEREIDPLGGRTRLGFRGHCLPPSHASSSRVTCTSTIPQTRGPCRARRCDRASGNAKAGDSMSPALAFENGV